MLSEIGLILICTGWIIQIIKMKKDELNKYALLSYVIGAVLLVIDGFIDNTVSSMDALQTFSVIVSGAVLVKLWMQKKKK